LISFVTVLFHEKTKQESEDLWAPAIQLSDSRPGATKLCSVILIHHPIRANTARHAGFMWKSSSFEILPSVRNGKAEGQDCFGLSFCLRRGHSQATAFSSWYFASVEIDQFKGG
jgi:hypothetical protein